MTGEGWIAAGEAAVGFDPLSSMGIGYAIASGIQAARIAAGTLGGDREHAQLFAADVRRHYDAYLARRQAYYAIEQRWPESPFWKRRILVDEEWTLWTSWTPRSTTSTEVHCVHRSRELLSRIHSRP